MRGKAHLKWRRWRGLHARCVLLCLLSPFQHAGTEVLLPVPGLALHLVSESMLPFGE